VLDVYASEPHYLDHALAVTAGLDRRVLVNSERMLAHATRRGVRAQLGSPRMQGGPCLVASYSDAREVQRERPLALVEHGAGQTYADAIHMGYAGGPGWDRLDLVLSPGPHAAQRWRDAYPNLLVIEIGAPPHAVRDPEWPTTVACTFHWPCTKSVEAGTAFYDWAPQVASLFGLRLLGHWHPKWAIPRRVNHVAQFYAEQGITHTADPEVVFACADLLVVDNSSLAYEFAATGRPVLLLNDSTFRKHVHHGLRFWDLLPGEVLDPGDSLRAGIERAQADPPDLAARRREVLPAVYRGTHDEGRAALAAWVQARGKGEQYAPSA